MNCKQVRQILTAYVDGETDQQTCLNIRAHLCSCEACRDALRTEQQTKACICRRIAAAEAPGDVVNRICRRLEVESVLLREVEACNRARWMHRVRKAGAIAGSTAGILALMLALLPTRNHHVHAVPEDGNIIHETYSRYDEAMESGFTPQIASSDRDSVRKFLSRKLRFPLNIPSLHECTFVGANVSRLHNTDVAELLYKHGNDIVYLYEASDDSVFNGHGLSLPEEARDSLKTSGWYVENHAPDCTLALWQPDSATVCCAVAEMSKDRLLAVFGDSAPQ